MPDVLLDYTLDATTVANPDGSFPLSITGATVTTGPGSIATGNYPSAVDLGSQGKGAVEIAGMAVDFGTFSARVIFNANGPVTGRQNLIESSLLPFALWIEGGRAAGQFDLVGSVSPKAHGWRTASTRFATGLKPGSWYTADLVYDTDTLGVYVDGLIVSVHAFPSGGLDKLSGNKLFVGSWVDGSRNHFDGKIAAIRLTAGIPDELGAQLDERRSQAEWFVTYKLEGLRKTLDLGEATAALSYDRSIDAYLQPYDRGALMYQDGVGAAFEMHGAIRDAYDKMRNRSVLGYLVSDEVNTTKSGGRKSVFSRGAFYWSPQTGAVPVTDQIYLDYEGLGESAAIGFPTKAAKSVPGGLEQEFQGARMYHKAGDPRAHEVHGAILSTFLSIGGVKTWGYPLTHESDIKKGSQVVGKYSEFEGCTIYWSSKTGAFEVHGDIRRKYQDLGGPTADLGFPTSNEADIAGVAGAARFNTFEKGSLLWYGSWSSMIVARPFKLFIGRINTDESEGFAMGQNDLYIKVTLQDGSTTVYNKKHPPSGDWGGHNIVDVNLNIPVVITPNAPKTVTLVIDVWESDSGAPFGGGDDHIGKWTKKLTMADGWGLRENGGILDSGSFSKVNSIKVSVKPEVDIASLTETQKFWGVANKSTASLSYAQYASAFSDVDSDTEWWDVTDWLEKAFYELVVEGIAGGGNCFGMALEAIYARRNSSLFSLPLDRFTDWNVVRPEVNVKHCYQVGSGPIWWFLGEFITGNTHDPKDVFNRTRSEFQRGNHPVLCISQNYDFSGKPHCILPVAWDSSSKPWKMTICDPNFPNTTKTLEVNPDANTFKYVGSSTYTGGEWSGGRLHYMPFSLLNSRPHTPIWDAILLLLAGTILILGDDAQTVAITDPDGNDLDGFGSRALEQLQRGAALNDYFVGFKGYDRIRDITNLPMREVRDLGSLVVATKAKPKGTIAGEMMMRMRPRSAQVQPGPAAVDPSVVAHLPVSELRANRALRTVSDAVGGRSALATALSGRTLHSIANDPVVMAEVSDAAREAIIAAVTAARPGDFRHTVAGLRSGAFKYAVKHGLSQFKLESSMAKAERAEVTVEDIGTSKHTVRIDSDRDKLITLEVDQKLGVARDRVKVTMEQIPVAKGKQLQMNLKPGLGGLELMTTAQQVNAPVTIDAVIDGTAIRRRFTVPIDGGMRLKLSTVLGENAVSVSRIENLFGPGSDARVIPGLG